MIILDSDLDRDPAPKATSTKRVGASASPAKSRDIRLPSARTLARFTGLAQKAVRLKGQVTVLLTTDAAIRKLNRQFRGKDKATDVLSFPAEGVGAEQIAGDLAISVTTALGHADEQGHSLSAEIKVLILHGLLHLAGYDHEADTGQMARRERLLRAKLGLPQGLIERAAANAHSPVRENAKIAQGGAERNPGSANPPTLPSRRAGPKSKAHAVLSGPGNLKNPSHTLRSRKTRP
jgi:probable rRNA maturation factor